MAWVALIYKMTYEEAKIVADGLGELACVSCRQYNRQLGEWDVKPIINRVLNGGTWYNYFEDGTYKITVHHNNCRYNRTGLVYSPYYYVPDKIKYSDLLRFLNQYWLQFKGKYDVYITYASKNLNEENGVDLFTYSVLNASMNVPLSMPFENPLLYYEAGRPSRLDEIG